MDCWRVLLTAERERERSIYLLVYSPVASAGPDWKQARNSFQVSCRVQGSKHLGHLPPLSPRNLQRTGSQVGQLGYQLVSGGKKTFDLGLNELKECACKSRHSRSTRGSDLCVGCHDYLYFNSIHDMSYAI